MRPGWIVPPLTRQRQALAAQPRLSAWVSANAGSGKTHVLVNRVLALLLDGVAPGRLLCITYTKAAAANMANRLFGVLAGWATVPEAALATALTELTGTPPRRERLALARELFARALETPGGLKIETIHAFCTRVLQSAPFEANVPPRFAVIDEIAQAEMLRLARRELIAEASAAPEGPVGQALDALAREAAQETFDAMMAEALKRRALFEDVAPAQLAAALEIAPGLTQSQVQARFRAELARLDDLASLIEALATRTETQIRAASALRAALHEAAADPVALCRSGLLTAENVLQAYVRGKSKNAIEGALLTVLEAVERLVCAAADDLAAIAIRDRSLALGLLAGRMLASLRRQKSERSLLDYDDLIEKTRSLLERVEASWVLYKLDAGIDHILLDEAQDTSGPQWAILSALAAEFSAGAGARAGGPPRTVFVVGDEKQSIYGFQGARPEAFGEERRRLGNAIAAAGQRFEPITLNTSFRSAPAIMTAVDAVFGQPEAARGLVFDGAARPEVHATVRQAAAGCVDLWPLSADDAADDPDAWTVPLDAPARRKGVAKLTGRIAATLARWTRAGRDDRGQPFQPGDVMILLRNRDALFETIVKALKDAGVPVAGRDRLTLADHAAVEDMLALGQTLLLPDDDLTLAVALKTPLFGFDEDDLMRLAPGRTGSLRAALREAEEQRYAQAEAQLIELERQAGLCGPFRFYAALLGPGGLRNRAVARLGAEAGDALDAFLAAALDHERRYSPSLSGFLRHLAGTGAEVKRDLSAPGSEVRVMTVHGAKGLEAKIVILADHGPRPNEKKLPKILALPVPGGGLVPAWGPPAKADCGATRRCKDVVMAGLAEEHNRLLYVALTRAEDRLIICGAQAKGEATEGSWYAMVASGLAAAPTGLMEVPAPDGEGIVHRFGSEPVLAPEIAPAMAAEPDSLTPAWLERPVPPEDEPAPPLNPSGALSAADGPDRTADGPFLAQAAASGRLAHLLLQMLPDVAPAERGPVADALAATRGRTLPEMRRAEIVKAALALLVVPELASLFSGDALAEAPIAGEIALPDGRRRAVSGRIDRLSVTPEEVVIADFKTTARPPADASTLPEATLLQLAAYRALVRAIYPGRRVRTLAIYTATLSVLEPGEDRLAAALSRL